MREFKKIKVCQIASVDMTLKFMLINQLRFLKSKGYVVKAVCSPGKWVKSIEKEGIPVTTITFKRKISPISDLIAFLKLFFYFKKEKFQIVHTHTLKPEIYGQIAAKLAGVPIIINTLHGFDFSDKDNFFKKKFILFLQRIAAYCSTTIFSIARHIIKTSVKEKIAPFQKFKYLGRDIDTKRFNPERFSKEFILKKKRELGIPKNKKIIGIVARLVKEKGFLELFEAFKKVLDKFPNALLLVVGPKEPEKRDAVSLKIVKNYNIEKNVLFLGERTDTDELYPLMDIFVLPSHREGLGAAILEASAMERPVVATRIGGCPEAIDDSRTGILVPLKNSEKLAEAIIYLLDNPEKAKEMGKEGRRKILKEFNEKLIFDRIKAEYQRLIKEKLK